MMQRTVLGIVAAAAAGLALPLPSAAAAGPSFDCKRVEAGSIAAQVCADAALSALDRRLAEVYAAARARAAHERPPTLAAEQRGWVKGRDDCWKAGDRRACIETAYRHRTAELQARYGLLPPTAEVRLACNGREADEVAARFFATDPPTLIAERGDQVSFMLGEPTASGTRYVGRNERWEEHQGEVRVQWGYEAPVMRCVARR